MATCGLVPHADWYHMQSEWVEVDGLCQGNLTWDLPCCTIQYISGAAWGPILHLSYSLGGQTPGLRKRFQRAESSTAVSLLKWLCMDSLPFLSSGISLILAPGSYSSPSPLNNLYSCLFLKKIFFLSWVWREVLNCFGRTITSGLLIMLSQPASERKSYLENQVRKVQPLYPCYERQRVAIVWSFCKLSVSC